MKNVELEKALFKALCKIIRHRQNIGSRLSVTLDDLSSEFAKVTGDYGYVFANDRLFNYGKEGSIKKFYALCYSLQNKGLVKVIKGHSKKGTRICIDKKGWEYINKLRAASK
jgi:hypothetical protein